MVEVCSLCHHSHVDGLKPTEDGKCVKLLFEGGGVRYCNCEGPKPEPTEESS